MRNHTTHFDDCGCLSERQERKFQLMKAIAVKYKLRDEEHSREGQGGWYRTPVDGLNIPKMIDKEFSRMWKEQTK